MTCPKNEFQNMIMNSGPVTRIYYRNTFFHVGHIKTLMDNEWSAENSRGICYVIIDDRHDPENFQSFVDELKYLNLTHLRVISVRQHYQTVIDFTKKLIMEGQIYLCQYSNQEHDPATVMRIVSRPNDHFQMRLKNGASIGYTSCAKNNDGQKSIDNDSLTVTLIFDYIIKVLDKFLGVTDIISTTSTDIRDIKDTNILEFFNSYFGSKVNYHQLDTYHIENFKYVKRGWCTGNEANPYLLTLKGMRARHIPSIILKAFYIHASQMGHINIRYLGELIDDYLSVHNKPAMAVINPVQVNINNWQRKRTEYVSDGTMKPLSSVFYVDLSDLGMDRKINVNRNFYIYPGINFKCVDVTLEKDRDVYVETTNSVPHGKRVNNWISSKWDSVPCKVMFYMYNWFYTGYNDLLDPKISEGYIDHSVFEDLDQIYYVSEHGYFIYDRQLSEQSRMPTFMRIAG